MPSLAIAPEKWKALCQYAAEHPTCKLVLHQHQGEIRRVTVARELDVEHCAEPIQPPLDKSVTSCP